MNAMAQKNTPRVAFAIIGVLYTILINLRLLPFHCPFHTE
jgi:hypothetical protein